MSSLHYRVWTYNMLNGLLFISGLLGLMGRAKRSSSTSSGAAGSRTPPPTIASSDAMPPLSPLLILLVLPSPCGNMDPNGDTAMSEAPGDNVNCGWAGLGEVLAAVSVSVYVLFIF
jgi:hypothetical protein